MKKILSAFFILVLIVMMGGLMGCQLDIPNEIAPREQDASFQFAKETAEFTLQQAINDGIAAWNGNSKIDALYPVYLDGVEGPSYYECKITTGREDAGYILVNVDKTDIQVPEMTDTGPTLNEQYRALLEGRDFKVYRYDWVASAAIGTSISSGRMILATAGLDNRPGITLFSETRNRAGSSVTAKLDAFRANVQAGGCVPLYTFPALEEYYTAKTLSRASTRTTTRSLFSRFANGWSTPAWRQVSNDAGEVVGCGPTAWSILFGYWHQFRNKRALLGNLDLSSRYSSSHSYDNQIYNSMWTIGNLVYTIQTTSWGLTLPQLMHMGAAYAGLKGYTFNYYSEDSSAGLNREKLVDHVLGQIGTDRPCILLINADGWGIANHYVVAEAATKHEKKGLLGWSTDTIGYLVNFGWGSTRKWIYHKGGENRYSIFTSYSIYIC